MVLAKWAAEGLRATVVRPFLVFGSGQSSRSFLGQALVAAGVGVAFPTSPGGQTRDFVALDQVVDDLLSAALDPVTLGQAVNSCTGVERTLSSVLDLIASYYPAFRPQLGAVGYRASEMMRSVGTPYRLRPEGEADKALHRFIRGAG
jgi:nucleoside-diphosphate-sugar epimerase